MRVGIIGSGFGLYGLLPAFNAIKGCTVVSICGKNTDRLLNYCKSIGLDKIYTNWEVMLANEKLDALAIAVTPEAQYKIAKAAIKKGIHVFAEKPLCVNYAQARELDVLAQKKKTVTAVDFIFQEIDEWQRVKKILDKKTYGDLKHISVSWDFLSFNIKNQMPSWKTDVSQGGGALSFFCSHVLYYLEYFVGEIRDIKSHLLYPKSGDFHKSDIVVDLLLSFKNGARGQVHVCCDAPGMNRHRVTFVCDKATLVLESNGGITDSFGLTVYTQGGPRQIGVKKLVDRKNNEDERVRIVKKIARRFLKAFQLKRAMTPSFKEGLRVQRLIENIRIANPIKRM